LRYLGWSPCRPLTNSAAISPAKNGSSP
jgi:hypothetical protein